MVQVPQAVKESVTRCKHNLICLESDCSDGQYPLCRVKYAAAENILFLNTDEYGDCPYQLPFGDGMICRCPVHYFLHNKRDSS